MDFLAQRNRCERVVVIITVMMVATAIGAGFRFKGGQFFRDRCAEAFEHVFQHCVLADAQEAFLRIAIDLGLGVAIAEVEGAAQQVARRCALDAVGCFLCCGDSDDASVVAFQQIAVAQDGAAYGEYGDFLTGCQLRAQAAFLAQVVGENELAVDLFSGIDFRMERQHDGFVEVLNVLSG